MTTPLVPDIVNAALRAGGGAREAVRVADAATARQPTRGINPSAKVVSPFYLKYLDQQAKAIRAQGGDDDAVQQFIDADRRKPMHALPSTFPEDVDVPSHLRGISMAVVQGATFGWGDEALGSLYGAVSGLGARRGIEEYRNEYAAYAAQHGTLSFTGELAGGLLTGALGAGAGATVGAVAREATIAGGVAGAGYADGPTASWNVGERLRGALLGASLGAVGGATMTGLGKFVRPVTQGIARATAPQPVQRFLGITSTERARQRLIQAFADDGISLGQARADAAKWLSDGVPVSLLELAPPDGAVHALVSDALKWRSPQITRTLAEAKLRFREQPQLLNSAVAKLLLKNDKFAFENADDVLRQLKVTAQQAARPHYVEAYGQTVPVSDDMLKILAHPDITAAWQRVVKRAADEDLILEGLMAKGHSAHEAGMIANITPGLAVPSLDDINVLHMLSKMPTPAPSKFASDLATRRGAAAPTVLELPVRAFNMLKQELDDIVTAKLPESLPAGEFWRAKQQAGKNLFQLRDQLLAPVKAQSQALRNALAIYDEYGGVKDAVGLARDFLRKQPAVIKRDLANLSPNERDFYRATVLQVLRDQIAQSVSAGRFDVARRLFQGQGAFTGRSMVAQRMRALFPDAPEAAERFLRLVQGTAQISEATQSALRGTRATMARRGDVDLLPARSSGLGEVLGVARQAIARAYKGFAQDEANEIAYLVGAGLNDPHYTYAILDELLGNTAKRTIRRARPRTAIVRTLGQQAGAGAGGEVTD